MEIATDSPSYFRADSLTNFFAQVSVDRPVRHNTNDDLFKERDKQKEDFFADPYL
jgi:hypothetical protein